MTSIDDMRIEWVPLEEIDRWPRNPKDHDLGLLYESFSRFGFVKPLLVDETTGKLIAGHGRLDALGMQFRSSPKSPPAGIKIAPNTISWLIPVIRGIAFKNETEAEAYLIADNRTSEQGGWLEDRLYVVLTDHADNLRGIGYDGDDLDKLAQDLDPGEEEVKPEIPFTAELLEEHNYVVFTFDKDFDWNVVASALEIKAVQALDSEGSYMRAGTGRVVDGQKLLDLLEID